MPGSFLNIAPGEEGAQQGGGGDPGDDPRFQIRGLHTHGFIALAFGFALGLTFMILFGIFWYFSLPNFLATWVNTVNPNLWLSFLYGFIAGTLLSAFYNLLIFRRLNLFGVDRQMD